jgi:filamin
MSSHWVDIQQNTFTRWCNEFLKERGYHITNLQKDLQDGIILCNLLEIISGGKSVGKYNKYPRVPAQKYENTALAMQFIAAEGIKTVK